MRRAVLAACRVLGAIACRSEPAARDTAPAPTTGDFSLGVRGT